MPLLLDVQADLRESRRRRLVIPLVPTDRFGTPMKRSHLPVEVNGNSYVLATSELVPVDHRQLGEQVASLAERSFEIVAAIDFLLHGFLTSES